MTITVGQLRAARGLIGWSQHDLARNAKVGRATIADFEAGKREPYSRTIEQLQASLEAAGVLFVAENGDGPGVRLKKAAPVVSELTEQIEAQKDKIDSIPSLVDAPPSPEGGMNVMRKALAENELVTMKNLRRKIKKGTKP